MSELATSPPKPHFLEALEHTLVAMSVTLAKLVSEVVTLVVSVCHSNQQSAPNLHQVWVFSTPAYLGRRVKYALGQDIRDINGLERGLRNSGVARQRRDCGAHKSRVYVFRVQRGEAGLESH